MRARRGLAAAFAVVAALTGCTKNSGPSSSDVVDTEVRKELAGLPSLEDTRAALKSAVDEIATAAGQIVPGLTWRDVAGEPDAPCGTPYNHTDGMVAFTASRVGEGASVSEQQWVQIQGAASRIAKKAGAPTLALLANGPGNHAVSFLGPAGMAIKLSSQETLSVSALTGCRLPADKK